MGTPQAADEGGEAPCHAHLVDPQSGQIAEAAGGRRPVDDRDPHDDPSRDPRRDRRRDRGREPAEGGPPAGPS